MIQRKPNNPRKVAINLAAKRARRKLRAIKGVWPDRDREYRKFIALYCCMTCFSSGFACDPAHVGPHGHSQKCSDYNTIPLCRICHAWQHAHPKVWREIYAIHAKNWIAEFNRTYAARLASEGREVPEALRKRLAPKDQK